MKSRGILSRLTSVAAALALTAAASAYVFILDDTGMVSTWREGTIPMRVKLNNSQALTDGKTQVQSVLAAMQEWNQHLGTVQFVGTPTAPGSYGIWDGTSEIVMDSAINVDGESFPFDDFTLAVTISFEDGNTVSESDIVFNTAYQWDSFRGGQSGSSQDIRRVAAHELGHVLGLDHPDEAIPRRFGDFLMNSVVSYSPSVEGPQPDDVAGAQALYGYPGFHPTNDNFADARELYIVPNADEWRFGTNVAASSESGEPSLDPDDPGGRTVWWKWTADVTGSLLVKTVGSSFDTLLGAYTGTSLGDLTELMINDDVESGVIRWSNVLINVNAGTTYYFAVDGWGGYVGTIQLIFDLRPAIMLSPPIFNSPPSTSRVVEGEQVVVGAGIDNPYGITFVWKRNGVALPGKTDPALNIGPATLDDTGLYEVVATNSNGSSSSFFFLHVVPPDLAVVVTGDNSSGQGVIPAFNGDLIDVDAAAKYVLGLTSQEDLYAWGDIPGDQPPGVYSHTGAVAVAAAPNHVLRLLRGGTLGTWGDAPNIYGVYPVAWEGVRTFLPLIAIDAGVDRSIALLSNRRVVSWGEGKDLSPPNGLKDVVAVAAGGKHFLALKEDGTVVGWGDSSAGADAPPPGLSNVTAIAAGGDAQSGHSLALKADGTVVAWGANASGQCDVPMGLNSVMAIAAGDKFSMALKSDGTIVTWGANDKGQRDVPELEEQVFGIAAGSEFSVAIVRAILPSIVSHPSGADVDTDAMVVLEVGATGTGTLIYQWMKDGVAISNDYGYTGADGPLLTIASAQVEHDGSYSVVVSNPAGSVESGSAAVNVTLRSAITVRPKSRGIEVGETVAFEVETDGAAAYTFEWRHNRIPIPGVTGPVLELESASSADAGYYEAIVSGGSVGVSTTVFYVAVAVPFPTLNEWGNGALEPPIVEEPILGIDVGGFGSAVVTSSGKVMIWGQNNYGEGVVPEGLDDVVAISTGGQHALALTGEGTVVGWGRNDADQAAPPAGLRDVVAISAGDYHSIALKSDGTVVNWGDIRKAQSSWGPLLRVPPGLKNVVAVKAVRDGNIVILSDGTQVSWNLYGSDNIQVPDAAFLDFDSPHYLFLKRDGTVVDLRNYVASAPADLTGVVRVAAGDYHSLALRNDGSVVHWGQNYFGEREFAAGLANVVEIAAKGHRMLALSRTVAPVVVTEPESQEIPAGELVAMTVQVTGSLPLTYQWRRNGVNLEDRVGLSGATTASLVIDKVAASDDGNYDVVVTNRAGSAVSEPAALRATTPPTFVQRPLSRVIGIGEPATFSAPATGSGTVSHEWFKDGVSINGATSETLSISVATMADGGNYEVVVRNSDGERRSTFQITVGPGNSSMLAVDGWGTIVHPAIGTHTSYTRLPANLGSVVKIATGYGSALALRTDGSVRGWEVSGLYPLEIPADVVGIVDVAVGLDFYLALRTDGTIRRWDRYSSPASAAVPVGLRGVIAIAARGKACLALKFDGTVVAWGMNAPPPGLSAVVEIAVGTRGGIALKRDGTVVAWDDGSGGLQPPPAGLSGVTAISAGPNQVLAVKADGTVVAWGLGAWGQVNVPVDLTDVVAVSAGETHSIAIKSDGSVVAWGDDNDDPIGGFPGLKPSAAVFAGDRYSFVLTSALVAPTISRHPLSSRELVGSTFSLSAQADGRPKPSFQWQKNGVDIPGATSTSFEIAGLTNAKAGSYRVVVSNPAGTVVSNEAVIEAYVKAAYPDFSPPFGTLVAGETVTITTSTPGATILYTTDDSTPSRTNGATYTGPVAITETTHLRAFALLDGAEDSDVRYSAYPVAPNLIPIALPSLMPRGVVGENFGAALQSADCNYGPRWSVAEGSLPAGLWLNPGGNIQGTPTDAGSSSFTLRLEDGDGVTGPADEDTLHLVITIDATNEVPSITTLSLPDAGLSLAYSTNLAGTGGNGPLTWSIASGSLPPGLTLSEGGLISGIPQSLGKRTFTVRVADDDAITGSEDEAMKELSIHVVAAPRLTNVSTRAFAGAGDDTLVVGFHIAGTGQKTVLIRGVGPKLLDYNVASVVADPRITLYADDVVIGTNNDWEAALAPVFIDAGAFALDVGSKDSAMIATLEPGSYTIHLVNNGPVAEGLVEVYDISRDAGSRLVNVSSRLRFQPGQLAILGTAVTGGPITILARNVGPGIAEYLVNPLDALPDPHLKLYAGQTMISENEDWDPALLPFFGSAGAFTIDEGSKDAAIRAQFQIGGYTVHSTGNGGEGVAIIEIYESP